MENSLTIQRKLLLRNGRLVLPDRIAEGASLLIEAGRIARILEQTIDVDIQADKTIELDGALLFPGFIDAHIHGAVGVDMMDADADDLHSASEYSRRACASDRSQ